MLMEVATPMAKATVNLSFIRNLPKNRTYKITQKYDLNFLFAKKIRGLWGYRLDAHE
jgi:hypothetical protein